MEHVELPPVPNSDKKNAEIEFRKIQITPEEDREIVFQKAQIRDVQEILDLINSYAASDLMLPRGPQYLYENIRDFVIASDHKVPVYSMMQTREVLHLIVGCGSLHVLWKDIAEIRSLAILPDYQHLGFAGKLVEYMKEEANQLGIRHLYTFTMNEEFFKTLGFKRLQREALPPKVWGECSRCPKFFKCDEVGLILEL
jgi:amino-acid N-acetyltransferase